MAQDTSVRLREATAGDAEEVTRVYLASRAAALPYLPRVHSDADTLAWITHVLLPGGRTWVAEGEAGELLGFASLDGGELDQLYLRPDVRRRGIGTLLLERAKEASRGELSLYTFRRNAAARAFYERHGFVAEAYDDGGRNEEREPDVLYRWTAAGRPADGSGSRGTAGPV
ncbi:GNAT family N-acetyltransferase [Streptomyces sp. NPDC057067]|uniref:GNAT family N-acetyltransferase n=1 Tax=Streptomyces TaxID=1883 RepID=UPI00192477DC|nr:GNAT family N-acetyltransferase [Streptomyces silvae]MBL1288016.1 GNAT family N-acetyltransferase [Streptomyces silvae]